MIVHSLASSEAELTPVLIKVQLLQTRLFDHPHTFAASWNWVDAYLHVEYSDRFPALYRTLRQAMVAWRSVR